MNTIDHRQQMFLKTHRVFNTDEWERYCSLSGHHSRNRLVKLTKRNKIRKIRNSLYSVVPEGMEYFTPPALLTAAKLTPDAVLVEVEEAMAALGELSGKTVREDITSRIFERFCVGK